MRLQKIKRRADYLASRTYAGERSESQSVSLHQQKNDVFRHVVFVASEADSNHVRKPHWWLSSASSKTGRHLDFRCSPQGENASESATLHQQKSVFCQATKGAFLHDVFRCAEHDVHYVRDVSYGRDVRSAREKGLIILSQSRNPSRLVRRTASFPQQALRCLARPQGPGPVIFCQNVRANVGKGFDIFLTLR